MIRTSVPVLLACVFVAASTRADWSDTAFPIKAHDFGTVAVAAKTEFRFPIENHFSSPMHIQSVRASCGCTTPIVEKSLIEPGQTGAVVARFNTDTFKGKRGATLTVVIDQPLYSEVRLRVDGYIRSDMVFHPGAIEFGQLNEGQPATMSSSVAYAGRGDWSILDVHSNRPWLRPSVLEKSRSGGRVNYEIKVELSDDAPVGFFQDELVVLTNDRTMPRVSLRVSGQIDSALQVSPQAIALGSLKPGQSVTQKLILLGREPFMIGSIQAEGWDIKFVPTTEAKRTHILYPEFRFTASSGGLQRSMLEITTIGDQSVTAQALLTAEIRDR
jgi:hypothetical protein